MLESQPEVRDRVAAELVGWLTTVSPDGQPQASAVWHIVDGGDLVVYSRPDATRLTNLAGNPRVAYNLRGDEHGDDIVTLEGLARVDPNQASALDTDAYLRKYRDEIERLGWTPEQYARDFSVPIRIEVTRIRAWS